MITVIAMSEQRYELAKMMPEMSGAKVLNPKDPRVNDFAVALETDSGDELVAKISGIAETYIHRGVYTHLKLIEWNGCGGAVFGNAHTIDIDKVPPIEIQ